MLGVWANLHSQHKFQQQARWQPLFLKHPKPSSKKKNNQKTLSKKKKKKREPAYLPTRILIFCITALKERSLSLKVSFTKGKIIHSGLENSRVRKVRNSSPRC